MDKEPEDLARRAASHLSGQFGAALPANLEAVIHGSARTGQRYEVATIIALATLLLNVAKFAWDLHKDLHKPAGPLPANDIIARRIRLEVALPDGVNTAQRDQIIATVIAELPIAAARTQTEGPGHA